jgi:glutamyl-tRNA reductase
MIAMHFLALALNHKSANLNFREKLALTPQDHQAVMAFAQQNPLIEDCAIVSTCNRLEFYLTTPQPEQTQHALVTLLSTLKQVDSETLYRHFCPRVDEAAVHHLMRVAAGLDSMVLGEAQILGQVTATYTSALTDGQIRANLSQLFQSAIHAGKRVRTETAIGRHSVSLSAIAVHLAQFHLQNLTEKTVLVLGAGEMGTLTVQALLKQGVQKIIVVSRSQASADRLADTWVQSTPSVTDVQAYTIDHLAQVLPQVDLVITSTSATQPVIQTTLLAQAMAKRAERPMLIVDLGLPRDVETTAADLLAVHLYNLDDLEQQAAKSLQERRKEIPQAEAILQEEVAQFLAWYYARAAVPTISQIRERYASIKEAELNRTLNRMAHLEQQDKALVAELAHRLLNKFLHHPTIHLKNEAVHQQGQLSDDHIQHLFGLHEEPIS